MFAFRRILIVRDSIEATCPGTEVLTKQMRSFHKQAARILPVWLSCIFVLGAATGCGLSSASWPKATQDRRPLPPALFRSLAMWLWWSRKTTVIPK